MIPPTRYQPQLGTPLRSTQLGLVSGGRNHRPYFRYLPDRLSDGQHGSHSVYHRLLAYVPGLLLHRLLHRPQTLRHSRLGLVHGFRHPCHYLCPDHIVATGSRRIIRSLDDLPYFLHHRTFPRHAFVRIEKSA